MTYAERAAAGAAFLDEQRPGWWLTVNGERLDMGECDACVLGQIYGDYMAGVSTLDLNAIGNGGIEGGVLLRDSVALGFDDDSFDARIGGGFAALTDAWRAEIAKRCEARR